MTDEWTTEGQSFVQCIFAWPIVIYTFETLNVFNFNFWMQIILHSIFCLSIILNCLKTFAQFNRNFSKSVAYITYALSVDDSLPELNLVIESHTSLKHWYFLCHWYFFLTLFSPRPNDTCVRSLSQADTDCPALAHWVHHGAAVHCGQTRQDKTSVHPSYRT